MFAIQDMNAVLTVMGIMLVIVVAYGIYRIATAGQRDGKMYQTMAKTQRGNTVSTVLVAVAAVAAFIVMLWWIIQAT